MLEIRYIENFQNNFPFLVIVGDKDDMLVAQEFFESADGAYLDDPRITGFIEIGNLSRDRISLNNEECRGIAESFESLANSNESGHHYFDTQALGDEIEIIISCGEYDNLRAL